MLKFKPVELEAVAGELSVRKQYFIRLGDKFAERYTSASKVSILALDMSKTIEELIEAIELAKSVRFAQTNEMTISSLCVKHGSGQLAFDEHDRIGQDLQEQKNWITLTACQLSSLLGRASRTARLARKLDTKAMRLCSALDDLLFIEHPRAHPSVYYRNQ